MQLPDCGEPPFPNSNNQTNDFLKTGDFFKTWDGFSQEKVLFT